MFSPSTAAMGLTPPGPDVERNPQTRKVVPIKAKITSHNVALNAFVYPRIRFSTSSSIEFLIPPYFRTQLLIISQHWWRRNLIYRLGRCILQILLVFRSVLCYKKFHWRAGSYAGGAACRYEELAMIFDWFFGMFSNDLAIDLGTANTVIYVKGKGIGARPRPFVPRPAAAADPEVAGGARLPRGGGGRAGDPLHRG